MDTLPPVAKNFLYQCKKCEQERFHKVLAHIDKEKAKIECEVCHSKKTLNIAKKAKKSTGRAGKSKVHREDENQKRFIELSEKLDSRDAVPYKMTSDFPVNTKIDHPTFGKGFVVAARPNQIEVVFADSLRSLVQNRK